MIKKLELNKYIKLMGSQNNITKVMNGIDIYIQSSRYGEGFPNVVMQAGAMRLPSIVSDINGCNEIIENNVNGLVINVKSIHSIYDAMINLSSDELLFNKLRLNSRDSIKIKYERKVYWGLLLKEYEKLINTNLV